MKLDSHSEAINSTTYPLSDSAPYDSPIVVALDKSSLKDALKVADQLNPQYCRVKVGKELFTRCGPSIVSELHKRHFEVFLDLKFHDIPNTTAQAVLAAADMGVWMVNVHANSGMQAMQESKKRLDMAGYKTLLIAVTVLTSMDETELKRLGVTGTVDQQVDRLALLTKESGLDGVVCSAMEAKRLKGLCGNDFKLVTPGIRMLEDTSDDQKRICTPSQAIHNGSDYLVIGRSITTADDPISKLTRILNSISDQ